MGGGPFLQCISRSLMSENIVIQMQSDKSRTKRIGISLPVLYKKPVYKKPYAEFQNHQEFTQKIDSRSEI